MNEILASYIEDLRDSILLFDESLMILQNGSRDKDTINNIFRVAHTIKGNSAAMSFLKIQGIMHTMEDLLTAVRNSEKTLTDKMIEILFACHDFLDDCLDVVQTQESDESMDTDALLKQLVDLKNDSGIQTAVSVPVAVTSESAAVKYDVNDAENADKQPIENMDLDIGMPIDIWASLEQKSKSGLSAYKLGIYFLKNSSMKSVRSWMIFDRIDHSAILAYSNPQRMNDSNINSADAPSFDANVINCVILSEHEISELIDDLSFTPDIEKVEAQSLSTSVIVERAEFAKKQKTVIDDMQEICVGVLGLDMQFINEKVLRDIITKMEKLVDSNIAHDGSPVVICAKRMVLALQEAVENKRKVSIAQSENIVFLCQTIEECIMTPSLAKNSNFISVVYKRLDDLIETVTSPDKRIGDILMSQGLIRSGDEDTIVQRSKDEGIKFGQAAVKEGLVTAYDVISALNNDKGVTKKSSGGFDADKKNSAVASSATAGDGGFVRVPVNKVDSLIDMLSELLIYNSQLNQSTAQLEFEDSGLSVALSRTGKLIKEIQDISMSLRMIEVKQTFHRLSRIVRDTAADLKKKVSINLEGEDTEIDRSAVEKLFDPLMHMVRNAVSHGIEEHESDRIAMGKKSEGQITIAGYSKRGNIYIEVRDDGRGINTEKVYKKAKEKGLINENREYSDQELFKFILLPGFSTQDNVNAISGRGVGMNVVEENITKLGGKIEIESEFKVGTTFRVKLPINLAVVNGIIVRMAGGKYIIPITCIKKFFTVTKNDWISIQGEIRAIRLDDGSIIPLISKEKVFGLSDEMRRSHDEGNAREYEMVLLEIDQKLLILHVDKIEDRQDVVSKPLGSDFAKVPYANGASILGDGSVSLILDMDAIFKLSQAT